MIGYMIAWDGVTLNSTFGQTSVSLSRSVSPSKSRIIGGASIDLDGMYTYPAEQTYSAQFIGRNGNVNARAMFQRLGRAGWLKAISRAGDNVINWAKLVSIENAYGVNDWITSDVNKYTLNFACSPFWYEDADTTTTFSNTQLRTVVNAGNARSSWLTIYITSAITNPLTITISRNSDSTYGLPKYGETVYNAETTQTITYAAAKPIGTQLVIDCRKNSVTLNGVDDYSDITLPSTQIDLGFLYPGSNRFTFNQNLTGTIVSRGAYV